MRLDKVGLNPNFTLARSWLDSKDPDNQKVKFMSDDAAIKNMQKYLGIENPNEDFPIAREIVNEGESNDYNVIVVIMEGMSYNKTAHGGNRPVPEIPETGFKRGAPDQGTASGQNQHRQRKTAYTAEDVFQRLVHG